MIGRFSLPLMLLLASSIAPIGSTVAADRDPQVVDRLFDRGNLVAWCIVPFDAKKRGPVERAEMLDRLNLRRFAYDYRAEHVPTFNAEMSALKEKRIALTAWWFPGGLNDEAKTILDVLERHGVKAQLWVTGGGGPTNTPEEHAARVRAEADRIAPIAQAAGRIGCRVSLYNHGGWFGEPDNQIAIIRALASRGVSNVGIVYNQHHGHAHVVDFPRLLAEMRPYLDCLNLNGMTVDGDRKGEKILPIGAGEQDVALLGQIVDSGYRGPIGVLNHTDHDAEARLLDNLDGLAWVAAQVAGRDAGPRPAYRTWQPKPKPNAAASTTEASSEAGRIAGSIPTEFDAEFARELARYATQHGDAARGVDVFASARFACISCHRLGDLGGRVGPEFSQLGRERTAEQIAASIAWPKHHVAPEYAAEAVQTSDGLTRRGYLAAETDSHISLRDPSTGETIAIPKGDVEERTPLGTLMPDGLATAMTLRQRADVVRLLADVGARHGVDRTGGVPDVDVATFAPRIRQLLSIAHGPEEFAYTGEPLRPDAHPAWRAPINKTRLYDFYAKQANHFRRPEFATAHLLPEFPGLDFGTNGHWGDQTEATWADDRWNATDLGSVQCGVFRGQGKTIPRGVCFRLGDGEEFSACFNIDTLTYDACWKDGFVGFSSVRHGFMHGVAMKGTALPRPDLPPPTAPSHYAGFVRHGRRIAFLYETDGVMQLDVPRIEQGRLTRDVRPLAEHPERRFAAGGPKQWTWEFVTQGERGTGSPFAIDVIPLPLQNPWKSLMFCGDHDFLPDGGALVTTITGDVWRVSGLNDGLERVTWTRFASGLNHPLGMKITPQGEVYVQCRDQLMLLKDVNGDGEADVYGCHSTAFQTSPNGHDFICGLERDAQGRFYTASGNQGLVRISADGRSAEVLATGFRNPDGLGLSRDGVATVPCSEGDWTPASMICAVHTDAAIAGSPNPGTPPFFGWGGPRNKQPPELPLVYLPRGVDNSAGGQTEIPLDRWGPFGGRMMHLSYGTGTSFLLLRDEVRGRMQGGIVALPGEFRSGAHRAKFHPRDGQLYVTGMGGWGNYAVDDGCFQRMRFTGLGAALPTAFHVHRNGVLVRFAEPLERGVADVAGNQFAQSWNYRYSAAYGSPEFSTRHPGVRGHDREPIAGAHLVEDDRTLFLELPELQPVNQLHLSLTPRSGERVEMYLTAHALDEPYVGVPGYRPVERTIAAHPLQRDLAALENTIPNPFRKRIANAKSVVVTTGPSLSFETRSIMVKAGEPIQLLLKNPDVAPHNWALAKPGSLERVGALANKLIADPDAAIRQYVPATDDMLAWTDIVPPHAEFAIHFHAPKEPGRYPYLCTFPGHWMVMNGVLIVE